MTKEEAEVVLKIMLTADLGCYVCSGRLFQKFVKVYPEHLKLAHEVYTAEHEGFDFMEDVD